jgi:UDP-glucuronate 4-epimerase
VTGAAGFIGAALCIKLLQRGDEVVGIDNLNGYYDTHLKFSRLQRLQDFSLFKFVKLDIADPVGLKALFVKEGFQRVLHLAAQAGVRYSLVNPHAYIESNIVGFTHILECCRYQALEHLVYASSSSVYGANTRMPFSVHDNVDHPVSLYAASKKANELMAHTYSHLFKLPTTGLRFFTVYGPWGRPDMSPFLFTRKILEGNPVDVFNYGRHSRDFTYIDDIVEGLAKVIDRPAESNNTWSSDHPDPSSSFAPYRLYNIGSNKPVELLAFIGALENCLGKKAIINLLPMQLGDVQDTYADMSDLENDFSYKPMTDIVKGIGQFVDWYKEYYT